MGLFSAISQPEQNSITPTETNTIDFWRDTPLRYAGYANEIGEAFRFRLPRLLVPSYAAAILYVVGDTADKTNKAVQSGMSFRDAACVGADAFSWQFLASVAIPGFVINRTVTYSREFLKSSSTVSIKHPFLRTWGPTVLGLSLIPVIISPIDAVVDVAFDRVLRPLFGISDIVSHSTTFHHHHSTSQVATKAPQLSASVVATTAIHEEPTPSLSSSTIFTKAQLEAMALYIDVECQQQNENFITCKAQHMDPELCLQAGKDVMLCVAQTFKKLNQPTTENHFRKYMECLDSHGGQFSKCSEAKDDLDRALGLTFKK